MALATSPSGSDRGGRIVVHGVGGQEALVAGPPADGLVLEPHHRALRNVVPQERFAKVGRQLRAVLVRRHAVHEPIICRKIKKTARRRVVGKYSSPKSFVSRFVFFHKY